MAYKALYRTYRPQDFDEVAGQEHITRTFKNALKNDKIAHAYLFSGPRGTGKTSIAKIIAKAVNCEHYPTENPCNQCENCKGIQYNLIDDVVEIDAASNNGVDEIREIRDKVKYLPGVVRYKVYIIDEVHMLSIGAFNALLKTLEEPPKHVIFILATTEPHKIPSTIHSRCQRFDFRGISVSEISLRMKEIIKDSDILIEEDAITLIAESAEGGMRDALSLLDQAISYTEDTISVNDIHEIRGTVSFEAIIDITNSISKNDAVTAIETFDQLINAGKEPLKIVQDMIAFYRDVLLYKNIRNKQLNGMIFNNREFKKLCTSVTNNHVYYYLDVLNKAQSDMKWSNNPKLYLEISLIKMMDREESKAIDYRNDINALQENIDFLSKEIDRLKNNNNYETTLDVIKESVEVEEQSKQVVVEPKLKDIYNKEEEPTVQEEEPIITNEEPDMVTETVLVQQDESQDINNTYPIEFIEKVLNNGNRELKRTIKEKWNTIERNASPELLNYASMLQEGELVATDGEKMLIVFEDYTFCNTMMRQDNKEEIERLVSIVFNRNIQLMTIPVDVWKEVYNEFVSKYRTIDKNGYITLSKIIHPGLKDLSGFIKPKQENVSKIVQDAYDLFGDKVIIKK